MPGGLRFCGLTQLLLLAAGVVVCVAGHDHDHDHDHDHAHDHDHSHEHEHEHEHAHSALEAVTQVGGHDTCGAHAAQKAFYEDVGCKMSGADGDEVGTPCHPMRNHPNASAHFAAARRRLAGTNAGTVWRPIRLKFDTSRLDADPGFMCTYAGEIVRLSQPSGGVDSVECKQGDVLTAAKRDYLKNEILPATKAWFEGILQVRAATNTAPIEIRGFRCVQYAFSCCSDQLKPGSHPDVDYVLHITGRPTQGSTLAWALACSDAADGRPVFGQANFGPSMTTVTPMPGAHDGANRARYADTLSTARHEVAHALGFSSSHFTKFVDGVTGSPLGLSKVMQTTTERGRTVTKIITRKVVDAVKEHFNCDNWASAGAEIEDGGGSGTGGSHWERRVFYNEFMTGASVLNPIYSDITLALFEDSGWYRADRTQAQFLAWGFRAGCGFPQEKCSTWPTTYFCKQQQQQSCSYDYLYKTQCSLSTSTTDLPLFHQYFTDPKQGGYSQLLDYCPVHMPRQDGSCQNEGPYLAYNSDRLFGGSRREEMGPDSRCFMQTANFGSGGSASAVPVCHTAKCDYSGAEPKLSIVFGTAEVKCQSDGDLVKIPGDSGSGTVTCPVAADMCLSLGDGKLSCPSTAAGPCDLAGTCQSNNICKCNANHFGIDCSFRRCPGWSSAAPESQCGGSARSLTCQNTTGICECKPAFKGADCGALVCPTNVTTKTEVGGSAIECSGHGQCDDTQGTCACFGGYSGDSCHNAAGCVQGVTGASSCHGNGTCDTISGACACAGSHYGRACLSRTPPAFTKLVAGAEDLTVSVGYKEYMYFEVDLTSSEHDVTVSVSAISNENGTMADMDVFAQITSGALPLYPTSLDHDFESSYIGKDEIHLCGAYGFRPTDQPYFPQGRNLNDKFRACTEPTQKFGSGVSKLYIGVLGYHCGTHEDLIPGLVKQCQGQFNISVEVDQCVIPGENGALVYNKCSGRGTCGKEVSGVCACEPGWGGPSCQEAVCGPTVGDPDPAKPGAVIQQFAADGVTPSLKPSQCYGNGVCMVVGVNDTFPGKPQCLCDSTHQFSNPETRNQEICLVEAQSVTVFKAQALGAAGGLQLRSCGFGAPLNTSALQATSGCRYFVENDTIAVGQWAVFRIAVPEGHRGLLLAELGHNPLRGSLSQRDFDLSDPMLLVRHGAMPTLDVFVNNSGAFEVGNGEAVVQHADHSGWSEDRTWSSAADGQSTTTRRVLIDGTSIYNENGGTLSQGRVYIAVYNSRYGRARMDFTLRTTLLNVASPNATCPSGEKGFSCSGRGVCKAVESSASPTCHCNQANNNSKLAWSAGGVLSSRTVFAGADCGKQVERITLPASGTITHTFSPPDRLAPGEWFYFDLETPQPFEKVEITLRPESLPQGHRLPSPLLLVREGAAQPAVPRLDRRALSDRSQASTLMTKSSAAQSIVLRDLAACDPTVQAVGVGCYKVGILNRASADGPLKFEVDLRMFASVVKDSCKADGDSRLCNSHGKCEDDSSVHGYRCACLAPWDGVSCASPVPFNLPQLQAAASRVRALCSSCEHTVSLRPGELSLFRVEQPVQASKGVAINAEALAGLGDPDLYVSKELPRTVYDFTRIAAADGATELMELREKYGTGVYWLAVLARAALNTTGPAAGGSGPGGVNTRRLGAEPSDGSKRVSYRVSASLLKLDVTEVSSVTDKKFSSELSNWLTGSTNGMATLIVCIIIMVCMCGGCLCRLCCSQDNKDTLRDDLDKKLKRATERKEAASAATERSAQRMSHIPNPVQDNVGSPTMEQRFGLQQGAGHSSPLHSAPLDHGIHRAPPPPRAAVQQPAPTAAAAPTRKAPSRRAADEI